MMSWRLTSAIGVAPFEVLFYIMFQRIFTFYNFAMASGYGRLDC